MIIDREVQKLSYRAFSGWKVGERDKTSKGDPVKTGGEVGRRAYKIMP